MTMSITRALSELTLLDKKIEKAIQKTDFVAKSVGAKAVKGFKTNDEYVNSVKEAYQSVQDLIKRRHSIKSAIVKSNAVKEVEIAGVKMTVAEAIERKTSIKYEQQLLRKLNNDFHHTNDAVEDENERVKGRLDKILEQSFSKDGKVKEEDSAVISKPFLEANEVKLIDPINARTEIDKLDESIEQFLKEVDYSLSEVNTITQIEV